MTGHARALSLFLVLPFLTVHAKDKPPIAGQASNDAVTITATAYTETSEITELIGSDIGPYYTVLAVTITPKAPKFKVDSDDFLLRTDKDGERTHPLAPSQIAGKADLILHEAASSTVGINKPGPTWGIGGMGGGVGGGKSTVPTQTTSTVNKEKAKEKHDPLYDVLKKKVLPDKETDEPLSGLLIFNLEKQKRKDLELVYTTPQGPLRLRFK